MFQTNPFAPPVQGRGGYGGGYESEMDRLRKALMENGGIGNGPILSRSAGAGFGNLLSRLAPGRGIPNRPFNLRPNFPGQGRVSSVPSYSSPTTPGIPYLPPVRNPMSMGGGSMPGAPVLGAAAAAPPPPSTAPAPMPSMPNFGLVEMEQPTPVNPGGIGGTPVGSSSVGAPQPGNDPEGIIPWYRVNPSRPVFGRHIYD